MKDSKVFYQGDLRKSYPVIKKGEGIYLFDNHGNKYIDAVGSCAVNIGYGNQKVSNAIVTQVEQISFTSNTVFSTEPQENLAKKIVSLCPKELTKVYFTSGGGEATDVAIKLARQYHLEKGDSFKCKVISRWQSYHGNTLGALGVSGRNFYRKNYIPYLSDVTHIPPPYCYRCSFGKEYPSCNIECALILERTIKQEGPQNVSAFISEPIIGASAAAVTPPLEYYKIIRSICSQYDVLMIMDEVITGIGRTGRNFAIEYWNVIPDIIIIGKGIAGGYAPLAGVIVSKKIFDAIADGSGHFIHHYTYSGHPIACAAGLAVLEYIEEEGLVKLVEKKGQYFLSKLKDLQRFDIIGDIRGKGLLFGIEYVADRKDKRPFTRETKLSEKIGDIAFKKGLIVLPGMGSVDGILGDHILLAPPFIINYSEIDEIVQIIEDVSLEVMGPI
jgi:adenosylmethionine-8-amino-7-oxononanoate aminotransferase